MSKHSLTQRPFQALAAATVTKPTPTPEPMASSPPAPPEHDDALLAADDPGDRRLITGYTRAQGEQVLKQGTIGELAQLRNAIIIERGRIQGEIDDEKATEIERRTELLKGGMHPREAEMRAEGECDHDWLVRARGAQRALDSWLNRVAARISELQPGGHPKNVGAVVVAGVGKHSTMVSTALNELIAKGVQIFAFGVVGGDLVVVGTAPKS